MAKKKKTRKQKMQTDQKRQRTQLLTSSPESMNQPVKAAKEPQQATERQENTIALPNSYTFTSTKRSSESAPTPKATVISTSEYSYLGRDLIKTLVLTSSIVVTELLILFGFRT